MSSWVCDGCMTMQEGEVAAEITRPGPRGTRVTEWHCGDCNEEAGR